MSTGSQASKIIERRTRSAPGRLPGAANQKMRHANGTHDTELYLTIVFIHFNTGKLYLSCL